ncbi:hypothetical protein FC96_GL002383 [Secundilactobacillus kimchicus JCM 15530]|uniref:Uncharacterized protein n=1 Tax=Secundilactobacillus kimchicus JCM 15530 TaxID=1302272 RepID=A0A0R1HMU5_9LACO|nr:hypothetical protein [Secundilactobacillus kimchicus]KRK47659.1 hypothetical protein FC96_GL002383 [Secundilactobacillus kimchicus JCM 15530]
MEKISKKTNKRLIVGVASVILMAPLMANSAVESWLGTVTTASASTSRTALDQVNLAARKAFAPERKVNQLVTSSIRKTHGVPVLNVTVRASKQNYVKKGDRITYRFSAKNVDLSQLKASSSKHLPFTYKKVNNRELQLTFNKALNRGQFAQAFAIPTRNVTSLTKVMASFDDHVLAIGHNRIQSRYVAPKVVETTTPTATTQAAQQTQETASQQQVTSTVTSTSTVQSHTAQRVGTTSETTPVAATTHQTKVTNQPSTTTKSVKVAPSSTTSVTAQGRATVSPQKSVERQVSAQDAYSAVMDRTTISVGDNAGSETGTSSATTTDSAATTATSVTDGTTASSQASTTSATTSATTTSTSSQGQTVDKSTDSTGSASTTTAPSASSTTTNDTTVTTVPTQTVKTAETTLKQYMTSADETTSDSTTTVANSQNTAVQTPAQEPVQETTATTDQTSQQQAVPTTATAASSTVSDQTQTGESSQTDSLSTQGEQLFETIRHQVMTKTASATSMEQAEITKALPWIWQNIAQRTTDALLDKGQVWQYQLQLSSGRMARISIDGRPMTTDTTSLDANMPALLKSLGDQSTPGMFDDAVDLDVLKESELYKVLTNLQTANSTGTNGLFSALSSWITHPQEMETLMTLSNPSKANEYAMTSGLFSLVGSVIQPIIGIGAVVLPVVLGATAVIGAVVASIGVALSGVLATAGLLIGGTIALLSIIPVTIAAVIVITHPIVTLAVLAGLAITAVAVTATVAAVATVSAAIVAGISALIAVPVALGVMSVLALPVFLAGHWLSDISTMNLTTTLRQLLKMAAPMTVNRLTTGHITLATTKVTLGNVMNSVMMVKPASFGLNANFIKATLPSLFAGLAAALSTKALSSELTTELGRGAVFNAAFRSTPFKTMMQVTHSVNAALTPGVTLGLGFSPLILAGVTFMLIALVPLAAFALKRMLAASRTLATMSQVMGQLLAGGRPTLKKAGLAESAVLAYIRRAGSLLATKFGPLGIRVMVGTTLLRVISLAMVVFGTPFKAIHLFNRLLRDTVFGTVNVLTDLIGFAMNGMTNTLHQVHNMIAPTVAVEVAAAEFGILQTANVKHLMGNLLGSLTRSIGEISSLTLAVTYLLAHVVQEQNPSAMAVAIVSLASFIILVVLAALAWRRLRQLAVLANHLTNYLGVRTAANGRQSSTLANSLGMSVVSFSRAKNVTVGAFTGDQPTVLSGDLTGGRFGIRARFMRQNFIALVNNSLG